MEKEMATQSSVLVSLRRRIIVPTIQLVSLVAQMVKNLPAMWETRVRSLDQEDPLVKERLPTPVSLPGEFQGQRSLVGLESML